MRQVFKEIQNPFRTKSEKKKITKRMKHKGTSQQVSKIRPEKTPFKTKGKKKTQKGTDQNEAPGTASW